MTDHDIVFIVTTSANLHDKMDADYLHPERVGMIQRLQDISNESGFHLKRVRDCITISNRRIETQSSDLITCIEMKDIDIDYGLINPRQCTIAEAGSSTVRCTGGDILFSRIRPYLNKVTLVPTNIPEAICSGEFFVLSPRDETVPMGYLWLVLRSECCWFQSRHISGGSARPRLEKGDLEDLVIPWLEEEDRIELNTLALNAVNDYHSNYLKLQNLDAHFYDKLGLIPPPPLPNLFFDIVQPNPSEIRPFYRMDPLYFHPEYGLHMRENLKNWAERHQGLVVALRDICVPSGIKRFKPIVRKNGTVPRLGVNSITGFGISWDCDFVITNHRHSHILIRKNDILISSSGTGSTGRVDIYEEDLPSVTDGHVTTVRLRPDVSPYYVLAYLRTEYAKRQMLRMERGSSGQLEISAEDLQGLLVPLPNETPTIESAQKPIQEINSSIRRVKMDLYAARNKFTQIFIGDHDSDHVVTTIPKPSWRIVRP